ncbi:MAG: lysylphosphatidylglycerol synthase domain-containing protein [Rhizobacter sp.]
MTTAIMSEPKRWWPHVKRIATATFFVLVAVLLYSQARHIEWSEVGTALRAYPITTLLAAGALAALSHAIYSGFDLFGRRWTGHGLPARQVVPLTFVCYAFNLNLGSLIGGYAMRYRLYSRLGLNTETTTRVLGMSMLTNWLGYLALAGTILATGVITPPAGWKLGELALQGLGVLMLIAAAAYLAACALSPKRSVSLRGHELTLPSGRFALLQMSVSALNWSVIGSVVYVLLQGRVDYPTVLGVLLMAAVAGVVTHVPAGLGVLEAVFIALLGSQVPRHELLGALLAYRVLYYLVPLAIATAIYLTLEARARTSAHPAGA